LSRADAGEGRRTGFAAPRRSPATAAHAGDGDGSVIVERCASTRRRAHEPARASERKPRARAVFAERN
jgi:hypothetical protein